jgi:hypothetical protein
MNLINIIVFYNLKLLLFNNKFYLGGKNMSEHVHVGMMVPDFEMETYNPKTGSFGKFSLVRG